MSSETTLQHKYAYSIDLESESAGAKIVRWIPEGSRVLEIGAGPGSISRPLVELKSCTVTAIELDTEAVSILEGFCEAVYQLNLNDEKWVDALSDIEPFQFIIIADVLEHLITPHTTLQSVHKVLADDGTILVSLPHIAHASIYSCLLTNDFRYGEWGLLDRTHIHFFGIKNIDDLASNCGFSIAKGEFVTWHPAECEFADKWQTLPEDVREFIGNQPYSSVYQVVFQLRKQKSYPQSLVLSNLEAPSLQDLIDNKKTGSKPDEDSRNHVVEHCSLPQLSKPKLIAFYLPQFHPIPENDEWWGKGFTEWTNVTKASPLFSGHYQPHLPTELGFYDLRLKEVQKEQIKLAQEYGIYGFCYHYYWFSGKRLLNQPLDQMLADKGLDMPFCLCWPNENWSRRWDASEHEILIEQRYLPDDNLNFIKDLLPFLKDERYIRINGKPLLIVYRMQQMPDAAKSIQVWDNFCQENGLPGIHVCAALTHGNTDYEQFGANSGVEFPPHNLHNCSSIAESIDLLNQFEGHIIEFKQIAQSYLSRDYTGKRIFRTVFPSWDNTARRHHRALVVLDGTPVNYEYWLKRTIENSFHQFCDCDENLLFINAWNEWAEGCHLEPDRHFGRQFLEATLRVLEGKSRVQGFTSSLTNYLSVSKSNIEPNCGSKVDSVPQSNVEPNCRPSVEPNCRPSVDSAPQLGEGSQIQQPVLPPNQLGYQANGTSLKKASNIGDATREVNVFSKVLIRAKSTASLMPDILIVRKLTQLALFDPNWYASQYLDVARTGVNLIWHFLTEGAAEGRDPNPLFDSDWYLEHNPDVAASGLNPLLHYLYQGSAQGCNPNPLFFSDWYLKYYPDVAAAKQNPLSHYLLQGANQGRYPNPLFDSHWYLEQNPDVKATGQNPLAHYLLRGALEGRDPNPFFDTDWYLEQNPDVKATGQNPLAHYLHRGALEGRDPNPLFKTSLYLAQNPDVKATGQNPLAHYLHRGAS